MNTLFDKPFNPSSGFQKRLFKGFPAYYARPDLQQYYDSVEHNLSLLGAVSGGEVEGAFKVGENSSWNEANSVYTLHLSQVEELKISYGKSYIEFPEGSFETIRTFQINRFATGAPIYQNIDYFLLVANSRVVTFSEDQDKGGVTGPSLSESLESSDVSEYYDYSIAVYRSPDDATNFPSTIGDKEVISCVGMFTFYWDNSNWVPLIISNYLERDKVSLNNLVVEGSPENVNTFPINGRLITIQGQLNYFLDVLHSLSSLALRIDGSNMAIADLYVNKPIGITATDSFPGPHKIITEEDNSTVNKRGIIRIATVDEVLAGASNSRAVTPFGLRKAGLLRKVIPLGSWDMDTDSSITIPHGLSADDFVGAFPSQVYIQEDNGNRHNLLSDGSSSVELDSTNAVITRGSSFDSASFSTISNRGFLVIELLNLENLDVLVPPTLEDLQDITVQIQLGDSSYGQLFTPTLNTNGNELVSDIWTVTDDSFDTNTYTITPQTLGVFLDFLQQGLFTVTRTVTVTDGSSFASAQDSFVVTVEDLNISIPTAVATHSDGTTSPRNINFPTAGISLSSDQSSTTNGTLQLFQWQHNIDGSGWIDFSSDEDPFLPIPSNGSYLVRLRVTDTAGQISEWSNTLDITATNQINSTVGSFVPLSPFVMDTDNVNQVTGSMTFEFGGVINSLDFQMRLKADFFYVEYDPNNVQTLPSDEPIIDLVEVMDLGNANSYNSNLTADRTAFVNALKALIETNNSVQNVGNGSILAVANGMYRVIYPVTLDRGTTFPNETLLINNPPQLAKKVRSNVFASNVNIS